MDTALIVALISGAVALASGGLALYGQRTLADLTREREAAKTAEDRRYEKEQVIARYREPLARAAYDLQSRFYNILEKDFIGVYLVRGSDHDRGYVIDNTAFLIAQYFAWTEIIRRDIQFLDLGQDQKSRDLAHLQDNIYALFQTDQQDFGAAFRVFAGEQRAIGERMTCDTDRGTQCFGYAAFLDRLSQGPEPLFEVLRDDVRALSTDQAAARPRLVALQNALIDLLKFLDPEFVRFPEDRRTKVAA